jgi:hypothetical protein
MTASDGEGVWESADNEDAYPSEGLGSSLDEIGMMRLGGGGFQRPSPCGHDIETE